MTPPPSSTDLPSDDSQPESSATDRAPAHQAPIRIGTRGSALARWQADWVAAELRRHGFPVDIITIETKGDVVNRPLNSLGGIGVFTKGIQDRLLDQSVDLAVHSLKDLPTDPTPGLLLAATPKRADTRDVFISRNRMSLDEIESGSFVGTGSVRRQAQLLARRGDLTVADIRGNVDTRLKKLAEGDYDAIVLAAAGLKRLGLLREEYELLDHGIMLPAVGQGALGLETRTDDANTISAVMRLNDPATFAAVTAERTLLRELRAGCLAPIGALAKTSAVGKFELSAAVFEPDGSRAIRSNHKLDFDPNSTGSTQTNDTNESITAMAESLGRRVAEELDSMGARRLIDSARS